MENTNNFTSDYSQNLKKLQKSELRSNATKLGFLLVLYNIAMMVYYVLFSAIFQIIIHGFKDFSIGYSLQTIAEASSGTVMLINILVFTFSCLTTLLCATTVCNINMKSLFKVPENTLKVSFTAYPAVMVINFLLAMVSNAILVFFQSKGTSIPEPDFSVSKVSAYTLIVQFLYVCVFAPIIEETIYRGLIIKLLSPFGKGFAIFTSALIFGLMHGNIPQALGAFGLGLVLAYVAVKFDSIIPAIIIHALNNLLPCLSDFLQALNIPLANTIYSIVFIGVILVGLLVIVRHANFTKPQKDESILLSKKTIILTFYLNIMMIIYFIYIGYSYVVSFIDANK